MGKLSLFSKEIPPACEYCKYGFLTRDGKTVLCEKKGVSNPYDSCRKYQYAPLKRVPKRPNALPKFDKSDFSL
ncbi:MULTISPECIES: hypothetical protein [Anaerotruncus]|jgi:hypothetical protein|uniref:hypothetical protein n=1 Tax=Anaerotruncus TaxID=244127 RepID=UPI00083351E0|nr:MULTISPECIES: hypothetical protein [Anaerotruncus]RGX54664.1 hypothetical protein DWV16_12800 [Anaerotruncus sp. AF02-27]